MKIEISTNGRELIIRVPLRMIRIEARRKATEIDIARLSALQREVLKGIMAGKQNKEIANDLNIGVRKTKYHVCEILAKTGLTRKQILGNFGSVQ